MEDVIAMSHDRTSWQPGSLAHGEVVVRSTAGPTAGSRWSHPIDPIDGPSLFESP